VNQSALQSIARLGQTAELFTPTAVPHSFTQLGRKLATAPRAATTLRLVSTAQINLNPPPYTLGRHQSRVRRASVVALKLLFL